DALHAALRDASAIVDGVFGTGLDRAIEGWRAAALAAMAASGVPVFALDLPSGVDADTGAVHGVAVPARLTATFAGYKRGHLTGPGRGLSGDVVVVDIGVPPPPAHDRVLELADAAAWLPARANDAHKGTAGHALVLAGEAGKSGAALLGGHGALRGGAGLVTLAVPRSAQSAYDARVLELMTASVTDAGSIRALAEGKRAVVLGPGFGLEPERRSLAVELARTLEPVTILDADALTAIGGDLGSLSGAPLRVLTPHPGEAARLLGSTTEAVQADRFGAAAALAERSGQLVVLKGAGTIVAQGGRCAVCPLGTPALGVAGTGDVLAGAIAAVIDGSAAFETACAAVLLHARAGELAAHTDRGLLAREVGDALPVALAEARLTR
ncbi:MAG: NAD(P)H-hydrate dehydratase, partial [Sandaracinaceae bacterium]